MAEGSLVGSLAPGRKDSALGRGLKWRGTSKHPPQTMRAISKGPRSI
jgi:hypothetical protein